MSVCLSVCLLGYACVAGFSVKGVETSYSLWTEIILLDVCVTVHHFSKTNWVTNKMQQLFGLLIFLNQPYMFRATDSPILRSTFDCIYSFWYNKPVGRIVGALCQKLYKQSKVLLRMGEYVARNMQGWFKRLINETVVASCWLLTSLYYCTHLFTIKLNCKQA